MKYFFVIIFIAGGLFGFSQTDNPKLIKNESQLAKLLSELRSVNDNPSIIKFNNEFKELLHKTLELDGAFEYPFASLSSIGKITSQDELVRIISWNVQYEDFSYDYFSFVMKKDSRRNKVFVTELNRTKQNFYMNQFEQVGAENWYGALYYEIIDVQKRNRTYYTLLGFDANNQRSKFKLIDALYFTGKTPHFGAPIFESERGKVQRLLFEYNAEANMSMKFDFDRNRIILDHLSPESPTMKEFREFYVPDMSYDAYVWNGNVWELEEDIIAINEERKKINLKAYDSKLDTVVDIPIKNEWIDPSNPNSPIDGGEHRAVMPDDGDQKVNTKKGTAKREKSKRKVKEDKNAIPGVSSFKKKR